MRFDGELKSWNDERGFGFIASRLGGDDVFVHRKAFHPRDGRPVVGRTYRFAVERGPDGRKRATAVEPVRRSSVVRPVPAKGSAISIVVLGLVATFVVVLGTATVLRYLPPWVLGAYAAASSVCALAYLVDKSAAQYGRRRVSESTLLGLGVVGGWPGGAIAQHVLRHKTRKASFQTGFRISVAMHLVVLVLLSVRWDETASFVERLAFFARP